MAQPPEIRPRREMLRASHRSGLQARRRFDNRRRRAKTVAGSEPSSVPNSVGGSGPEPSGGAAEPKQEPGLRLLRALQGTRKAVHGIRQVLPVEESRSERSAEADERGAGELREGIQCGESTGR